MPGLFGIVNLNPRTRLECSAAPDALLAMAATLSCGPDSVVRQWVDPAGRVAVGSIGLEKLMPPALTTRDGSRVVTYGQIHEHGRFVNDVEEGRFDGEDEQLRALRGSWTMLRYHPGTGQLMLAADRRATIPLVYAQLGDILVFAPEQKALLVFDEMPRDLSPAAAASLLSSGWLLSHQAPLQAARRLPGGHALDLEDGRLEERTYWNFAPGAAANGHAAADLEDRLAQLIRESAQVHLGDPKETLIFLSGGADSRAILGAALAAVPDGAPALNTVTWGHDDAPGSDLDVARKIVASTGVCHREVARETGDYGAAFRELNNINEAFSDVAAFHPHEYRLMQKLRALGFSRVLRGDETFGWSHSVTDFTGAAVEVGVRRFGELERAAAIVRPEHHARWSEASAQAWAKLQASHAGESPNRAKDSLYFNHRLQGMLGPSAYYKQIVFDHRNVLLDEPILDLLSEASDRERIHKQLYLKAARKVTPELFGSFPLASHQSLENWSKEIAAGGSVRAFLDEQLDDRSSPAWDVLDLEGVRALAKAAANGAAAPPPRGWQHGIRPRLRKIVYTLMPTLAASTHAQRAGRRLGVTHALLRSLVLKDWLDQVARSASRVAAARLTRRVDFA